MEKTGYIIILKKKRVFLNMYFHKIILCGLNYGLIINQNDSCFLYKLQQENKKLKLEQHLGITPTTTMEILSREEIRNRMLRQQ